MHFRHILFHNFRRMVIPTSLLPETIAMDVAALHRPIALTPGKRVLFLTKDMDLIKQQLYHGLNLQMKDINPEDLLDDINTDVMTPAWVCFDHDPAEIAKNAYAGLKHNGLRVFNENALINGNFEVIVSGQRKGTGSSRETAAQCERCLLYTSPSPRDRQKSRMPSSA